MPINAHFKTGLSMTGPLGVGHGQPMGGPPILTALIPLFQSPIKSKRILPISPEKMQQRKPTAGRPSGTDGSDFSYRMVVDSRYTKVTKEKARLRPLIFVQAAIYLIGLSCAFLTTTKKDERNTLAIAAAAAGLVSSFIGELGCRRSRVNLLRLYTAASTIVMVLSVFCAVRSRLTMEERNSTGTTAKLELAGFICAQLGAVVQILVIIVTGSLVNNMSPPTKAA